MQTSSRANADRHAPVIGVIVASLAVGAIAWWFWLRDLAAPSGRVSFPLWLLAAMFAVAEIFVLHVQVRREAQTVSLSEIPLVLGLFYATPHTMLLARLVGLLVIVFHRRHRSALKLAFNAAMFTMDLMIAVAVFRAVVGGGDVLGPRGWLAAFAATAAFGCFDGALLTFVIGSFESRLDRREIVREAVSSAAMSAAVATLGLIAVTSLAEDARIAWLLAAAGVVLVMGFRAYARLNERHLSLERLYKFSQVVTTTPDGDDVLRHVLEQARELLHAEQAAATFVSNDGTPGMRVVLSPSGRLVHSPDTNHLDDLERTVLRGEPALVSRESKDTLRRTYLERRGYREAIVMPLHGENSVVGTLCVADRMGAVRTFDESDAQLLETVANHAGVALQKGRLIDQLRHEALHDALTGLPNRVFLRHRLREAMQRQASGESIGVAAMIMDLNRFKEVNDTLGHQQGDDLLVDVSQRLVAALRPGATVARLGGDEFAVLLPDAFDPDDVVEVARELLAALERPFLLEDITLDVGASIGVALAPEHAADSSELLKCADLAMYAAKATGVGICMYDSGLDHGSPQDLALLGELRQGIARGELTVHVQPKAQLRTGDVAAVEALVRWEHPYRGTLLPDAFVPAAERSDLIRPLTLSVLSMGVAACAAWRAAGHNIGVAVNVSARSLLDMGLPDDIATLLADHGVPAHLLTIELTESSVMTDPVRTIELLMRLHDMGVRLSVDDFGTGYSSLSYLKRLPVDEVKIDRGFVTDMQHSADDTMIVRSIIDLGANLSLSVVAEGVEDLQTWQALGKFGCEYAQGYHLSGPLPLEAFLPWLDRYEAARELATPRSA
ncbi:MAG: putative Diguanylate cyclase/phosphodiesterase [Actinomycetia bacterium]|nr:putative Diguanylate cyclase/phosphodiesterase [Actinomycetes bacterium]